jgi:hypothetical protein
LNHVAGDLGIPSESALLRIGISRRYSSLYGIASPSLSASNNMPIVNFRLCPFVKISASEKEKDLSF